MIRNIFLCLALICIFPKVQAQKQPLNLDTWLSWPIAINAELSPDGAYAFYTIYNEPVGESTFVLVETVNNRSVKAKGLYAAKFCSQDHYVYGRLPNDTLVKIDLHTFIPEKIPHVKTYQNFEYNGKEWSSLLMKDTLVLSSGGNSFQIKHVQSYIISPNGKFIIIEDAIDGKTKHVDLATKNTLSIFDHKAVDIIFSPDCKQLAFMVATADGNQIWQGAINAKARLLIDKADTGLKIENAGLWRFSKDGRLLFFTLNKSIANNDNPNFMVWHYQDAYLKSASQKMSKSAVESRQYAAVINLATKEVRQLTFGNQKIMSFPEKNDDICLIEESFGRIEEANFISSARTSYYFANINNHKLTAIRENSLYGLQQLVLSPDGKYIIYFDQDSAAYYSYHTPSGKIISLTKKLPTEFRNITLEGYPANNHPPVGIVGWSEDALFISSAYDLWKIDPQGKKAAVNLTATGENIVYYPMFNGSIVKDNKILLTGFNLDTKDLGFYEVVPDGKSGLKKLSSQAIYSGDLEAVYVTPDFVKAATSDCYLLRYSKTAEYPNFYFSKDLRSFKQISYLAPHKEFNWMTAELHNYNDKLGHQLSGILYKPENFDARKRYPVVINYYTKTSDGLNEFESPELGGGDINVAQLVSNGYIVFKADIYPEQGHAGEAALNSIIAAADHLSKYTYIDTTKMAIAGHSFGGFETNYIVTHSSRFAAAISAAGVSNLTDLYNAIFTDYGMSLQSYVLTGPPLMYKTLSEDRDRYIENSPIFSAKQMNTPLLLMHNENDANVPFSQGLQFFVELRSLQKPVWLLSFKGEGHVIGDENNKLEYYKKVNEFLGFYLKGEAKPAWMSEHI